MKQTNKQTTYYLKNVATSCNRRINSHYKNGLYLEEWENGAGNVIEGQEERKFSLYTHVYAREKKTAAHSLT